MVFRGGTGIAATAVIALAAVSAEPANASILNRWIQYAPNNTVLARAIVTDAVCPNLVVAGVGYTMQVRYPTSTDFPAKLCEATLPIGADSANLGGQDLPMPSPAPQRIVLLGDTGCRLKSPTFQACNDANGFPLNKIAKLVAATKPDAIVHVGDYYYRETACPTGNTGCAGSPFGDNWASWNADWFTPANPMFSVAPMVLARGNHESCGRGAKGWFALLEPRAYDASAFNCKAGDNADFVLTYAAKLGKANVIVHDSSYADDATVSATTVNRYAGDLGQAFQNLSGENWLVTHRPPYGVAAVDAAANTASGGNANLQTLFRNGITGAVKLIVSGHIHNFQFTDLGDPWPAQLVVGEGGVALDDINTTPLGGKTYVGASTKQPILRGRLDKSWGYVVLDNTRIGWLASVFDQNGNAFAVCSINTGTRRMDCTQ